MLRVLKTGIIFGGVLINNNILINKTQSLSHIARRNALMRPSSRPITGGVVVGDQLTPQQSATLNTYINWADHKVEEATGVKIREVTARLHSVNK